MDIVDRALDESERHLTIAIKNARSANKSSVYTGHCRHCNDAITKGLFCNDWCSSDYEDEQIIRKRQGKF